LINNAIVLYTVIGFKPFVKTTVKINMKKSVGLITVAISALFLNISCKKNNDGSTTLPSIVSKPNILLIIADDMGLDATPNYTVGAAKPNMPVLQGLMQNGVSFDNVWGNPECSPTRASILTGKYGYHTGVLSVSTNNEIPLSETSIQKYLDEKTGSAYSHAVIGKWHLGGTSNGGINNPGNMGVGHYAGFLIGAMQNYSNWTLTTDGTQQNCTEYATSKFTDLAIDWIGKQDKPWFLWLAYTAPHTPFHLPPLNLHDRDNLSPDSASINATPQPYFFAMMEAMDTEIGRLLSSMSEAERNNTLIVFIGDNGTTREVIQTPYSKQKAKGTVYQGGIAIPLVVSGSGVTRKGEHEGALVNLTDLFATVADVAGTGTTAINDSKSLRPLFTKTDNNFREFVYSELKSNTLDYWTARNTNYKLIEYAAGTKEMYDLSTDPYEKTDLIKGTLTTEQTTAKLALEAEIARIRK
jgi:arylsulfatase A-like enzyme